MANLSAEMFKLGGFENYGVPFCMTVEAEALGAPVFLGTKSTEPRVSAYILENSRDWNRLEPIDYSKGRVRTVLDAIALLKQQSDALNPLPIIGNLTGPISLASSLVDANVFYKEMRKDPEAVHALLRCLTDELIVFGLKQLEAGADVITISDPSGTGEILGAKQFEAFVLPYLNEITNALTPKAAMGVMVHICGRLSPIFSKLNSLDAKVLSFDAITNVTEVGRHVHGKTLMGNVSTYALEFGTPEQVEKLALNCMSQGATILSPACGVGARTKMTQIKAMVEAAKGLAEPMARGLEDEGKSDAL
jgi:MtaA/CmuA family methyltransferase